METRPCRDADSAIAEARGFKSASAWREFRDASPERQAELIREFRARKTNSEDDDLRSDLEFMRSAK